MLVFNLDLSFIERAVLSIKEWDDVEIYFCVFTYSEVDWKIQYFSVSE